MIWTCDVVVVGGGIAGLSAAISAAENGARVSVLERSPQEHTGGNTRYSPALIPASRRPEDLVDALLPWDSNANDDGLLQMEDQFPAGGRSRLRQGHHALDPDYIEAFAASSGAALAWLASHGIRFEEVPARFLTRPSTRRAPVGGGLALVEGLGVAARRSGVHFHFLTTARELLLDADGAVIGVRSRTPNGRADVIGRVVLASGGYQGNAEMMARYLGDRAYLTRPAARGGNHNKGDGIEMALAIGAATAGRFTAIYPEPVDPRSMRGDAAVLCFPYGVLVNREGDRFVDEAQWTHGSETWYVPTTRSILEQPSGIAHVVLDARSMAVPDIRAGIGTAEPALVADTIGKLAVRMAVSPKRLKHTIATYNAACGDAGYTAPGRRPTSALHPPKSCWAVRIDEPPFEAIPIIAANVSTLGGLKTDGLARVLDRDGTPITGLYAAGEVTGSGSRQAAVLAGAVFGKIAGAHAAQNAT